MKAVIMAGGEGRRLKCITGALPKPMVPLLGRPMLEHILRLLKKHGFDEVCAAVKYRAEDIMDYFGDGSALGISLEYRVEREALGTAGGVKNCADFYGAEDFLVISGDAACDFDLSRLMHSHRESGAGVTIALCRSAEPLSYGLAVTDGEGRIKSFIEKPTWPRVVTDFVNTGIYIVSPRVMTLVPPGQPFDFGRELFPLLLRRSELLRGEVMQGYWCDVGTPLSYYQCCVDALSGRLDISPAPEFSLPRDTAAEEDESTDSSGIICPCRDRAELMGTLSELFMEMDADYSEGLRVRGEGYEMHIAPLASLSAVRVAVESEREEFARELSAAAQELIRALDK